MINDKDLHADFHNGEEELKIYIGFDDFCIDIENALYSI